MLHHGSRASCPSFSVPPAEQTPLCEHLTLSKLAAVHVAMAIRWVSTHLQFHCDMTIAASILLATLTKESTGEDIKAK